MAVNFRCRRCGLGLWLREIAAAEVRCSRCAQLHRIDPMAALNPQGQLVRCTVCGCDQLYRQRDFNRKLGIAIVAVAAVLAPFTRYLSLVAAALLDLLLYVRVGEIALCYHCAAIHRGLQMGPGIAAYDLATHERFENRDWGAGAT
jgi:hypothetical protein